MIAQTIQLGNLHPLIVHLPIGILIVGFILEVLYLKQPSKTAKDIVLKVLLVGFISAVVSLATGWFLGENGGYDETLLFRHRWLAVCFTVLSGLLYLLKRASSNWATKSYLPLFGFTLLIIGITGHYGGSMTHGEDFLFKDASIKKVIIEDVEKAKVYADIIQPIFDNKCVSCHNPSKIKGGLLMDNRQNLLAGGDSGSILDSVSKDKASPLITRLHLPLKDEDHMPPKGKVQPTSDELLLLEWWLEHQNCFDCIAGTLDKSDKIKNILVSLEEDTSTRALIAKELTPVPNEWLLGLNNTKISANTLAEGNPLVQVSLYGRNDITAQDFKSLKKYAKNIVELNLGHSNFNDTLAKTIGSFKNLTKLQLQHTAITGQTLEKLKDLEHLESLNLYGNKISDNDLEHLRQLPKLTNIYLFQTKITTEAIAEFAENHPTIKVQGQIDDALFKATKLDPPNIIADTDFFKDSLRITLDYVFDDIDIYYTLDGTAPDSTSIRYTKPILITESTQINACTHAKGWKLSTINSSSFKKFKFDYSSIAFDKKPNERYKGQGSKTLIDHKRGTTNFVDGNWIGFEGTHFTATLQLKQQETISTVSVGALSSTEKWIFYPTGFNIWASDNGTDYRLIKNHGIPSEKINTETRSKFFDIGIPPTKAKYVKVQIKSQLKNPSWHPNPGGNSWLFIDEIVLN